MSDEEYSDIESALIYKNVLQNMQDGVIAIASNGKIITLNSPAANILLINDKEYIGEPFTTIFSELLLDPRNDELNDAMLSAIYESKTTHHKDVKYYANGTCKDLLVSSTALFIEREGISVKVGMIIVLSDITQRQRLAHIQNLFGKYVDPNIATRIIEQPENELMKADRQVITVSFCDMNHFTSLCETLSPSAMETLMNLFLSKMSRSVHKNQGIIDKFIGDAVMSFWGFPFIIGVNHSSNGCQTALDQIASLTELNQEIKSIKEIEHLTINIGIGIATGELIIANVGSEERKSFTVMGNIVNLASRLVGVNKIYGTQILVSDEVFNKTKADFTFREIDTIVVKGKEQQTTIYELLGTKAAINEKLKFVESYSKGLKYYRTRDWRNAITYFEKAHQLNPDDKASLLFLERITYYKANPPDDSWLGVWILDKK